MTSASRTTTGNREMDILVLGATGFTGRLVTRYLFTHPQRDSFTFGISARSKSKLDALVSELGIDDRVPHVLVDITDTAQLDAAVARAKVVIDVIGPYWLWGTPVVQACVRQGTHHVNLSGEPHWIKKIIDEFDYHATKTGAIIIPACGFDSMPSDISAYTSNKTIKSILGPDASIENSLTGFRIKAGPPSGGTLATAICAFETLSFSDIKRMKSQKYLSPIPGHSRPQKAFYTLTGTPLSPPITGSYFLGSPANRAIVERTWGLHELQLLQHPRDDDDSDHFKRLSYGPDFVYDEFLITNNIFLSILLNIGSALLTLCLMTPPIRTLIKRFGTQSGNGPSEETMRNGRLETINVSSTTPTTTTPDRPQIHVRSVSRGRGDPAYSLTAVMISEAALAIALSHQQLPELGRRGGVLTPMSALGDVLIERLKDSGRFEFESEVLEI